MYRKEYYEENKDKFARYAKKYYEKHKAELKEYHKKYFKENKEKIYEKQREWRESNNDRVVKSICNSRKRRIEKLKEEGVTNPWGVVMRGSKPVYKEEKSEKNTRIRYD